MKETALALQERQQEEMEKQLAEREEELETLKREEAAIKKEELALEKKRLLKEELLREEEAAKKKIADEREADRIKKIKKRQSIQEVALRAFLKTKYDELELLNGKVLKSAEVIDATPVGVKFMHQTGVSTVKYSDLPEEVCVVCKYDKELETLELAERKVEQSKELAKREVNRLKRLALAKNQTKKSTVNDVSVKSNDTIKIDKTLVAKSKEIVKPKGILTVMLVGSGKGGKTIEVVVKSNVDATLYLNDWHYRRELKVKAGEVFRHTWRGVKDKYEVKLTADDNGALLDMESSSKKSGLDRRRGL